MDDLNSDSEDDDNYSQEDGEFPEKMDLDEALLRASTKAALGDDNKYDMNDMFDNLFNYLRH